MADSKKYDGSQWVHSLRKLGTATETIQSGDTIYANGQSISTYSIKGNTVQSGTPTPSNPVEVVGVGELETTGEHAGEYKIPISNGQQTTNIYLGSTQTTRQIKKLVLTGSEVDITYTSGNAPFKIGLAAPMKFIDNNFVWWKCTHYQAVSNSSSWSTYDYLISYSATEKVDDTMPFLRIRDIRYTSAADFKAFLATEYANGTPVTIYYVLATETTGAVNEELQSIYNYTDTLSNATSIPTTEGANSITVDTTVQPSEFTATWTGWHDSSVKEYDGSDWQ